MNGMKPNGIVIWFRIFLMKSHQIDFLTDIFCITLCNFVFSLVPMNLGRRLCNKTNQSLFK